MGYNSFPLSEREYSTWGGISLNCALKTIPSCSNSFNVFASMVLVISPMRFFNAPKRIVSTFVNSKIMRICHLPEKILSSFFTGHSEFKSVLARRGSKSTPSAWFGEDHLRWLTAWEQAAKIMVQAASASIYKAVYSGRKRFSWDSFSCCPTFTHWVQTITFWDKKTKLSQRVFPGGVDF